MAWNHGSGASGRTITKQDTKVCPLCGVLNYQHNTECFTCGWHGRFGPDDSARDYQWQRLVERFEEVRLEHVMARSARTVGEFGEVRKTSPWQRLRTVVTGRWQAFLVRRDARCAAREAALRPRAPARRLP